ncbi:uncharacterized mitochondrial protein-like protein [Tanacetum coccineum]
MIQTQKALVPTRYNNKILIGQEFDAEPVTYAMMALTGVEQDDWMHRGCLPGNGHLDKMDLVILTGATKLMMHQTEILGYQMSLESLEVMLKTHEKNEYAWGDKYEQMEYDLKIRDLKLEEKQKELDQALKDEMISKSRVPQAVLSRSTDGSYYPRAIMRKNSRTMIIIDVDGSGKYDRRQGQVRLILKELKVVMCLLEMTLKELLERMICLQLDLKNIIPSGGITCLVAKATEDEALFYGTEMGIKGKQHRASCKKIEERTVREPLELLHMDLFGPVSVESINKKKYCLVVTDDCSKFSVFMVTEFQDSTYEWSLCKEEGIRENIALPGLHSKWVLQKERIGLLLKLLELEPRIVSQALADECWLKAYEEELLQFKLQETICKRHSQQVDFRTLSQHLLLLKLHLKIPRKKIYEEGEDVDVHLYRSMIGCLMYLTASRPDIMFAVCLCARFQVTPKVSHLHAVKRIFRDYARDTMIVDQLPEDVNILAED